MALSYINNKEIKFGSSKPLNGVYTPGSPTREYEPLDSLGIYLNSGIPLSYGVENNRYMSMSDEFAATSQGNSYSFNQLFAAQMILGFKLHDRFIACDTEHKIIGTEPLLHKAYLAEITEKTLDYFKIKIYEEKTRTFCIRMSSSEVPTSYVDLTNSFDENGLNLTQTDRQSFLSYYRFYPLTARDPSSRFEETLGVDYYLLPSDEGLKELSRDILSKFNAFISSEGSALTSLGNTAFAYAGDINYVLNYKGEMPEAAVSAAKKAEVILGQVEEMHADINQLLPEMEENLELTKQYRDEAMSTEIGTVREDVNQLKGDISNNYVQRKSIIGKNLYNPSNNTTGKIIPVTVGKPVLIDSDDSFVTQKIEIEPTKTYSIKGIRIWELADENDCVVKTTEFVDENHSYQIDMSSYSNIKYLYVSTYIINVNKDAQVEIGNLSTEYEPYIEKYGYFVGNENNNIPVVNDEEESLESVWSSKKISDELANVENNIDDKVLGTSYELNIENQRLLDELQKRKSFDNGIDALANVSNGIEKSSKIIYLNKIGKQKLIVHLHRKESNVNASTTDVFLPNSMKDFSDVRITDNNGNVLSYDVVFNGNIDIVADYNLVTNPTGRIFTNSNGEWITYNHIKGIAKSADRGNTWTKLTESPVDSPIVCLVTSDDVIFYSKSGILYRSEYPYNSYEIVMDISSRRGAFILSTSMAEYDDGTLFCCTYQDEYMIQVYKSTDKGKTWSICLNETKYQHIHNIFLDKTTNPTTIYVGCDGGGGVFKSIDKGNTWVNLRAEHPNMPQSTDYGVIYAENGYRLLGGETGIVGGYSIIKTSDDINFVGKLGIGNSIYSIQKLNGKLFAGYVATNSWRQTGILMSEDEGETWVSVYNSSNLEGLGVSDGYRYVDKLGNELICGAQDTSKRSNKMPSVRITANEDDYYAEILVDIPNGVNSITVESGYVYGKHRKLFNECDSSLERIVDFRLSEDNDVIKDIVNNRYYKGNYSFKDCGKHIGNIYPYISKTSESKSFIIPSNFEGFIVDDVDFDNNNGITISFWANFGMNSRIIFISDEGNTNGSKCWMNGYILCFGNTEVTGELYFPRVKYSFDFFVITIDTTNNNVTVYRNGQHKVTKTNVSAIQTWFNKLKNNTSIRVLSSTTVDDSCIQMFRINKGIISAEEVFKCYYDGLSDNLI